jgi:hypothetical protein
MSHYEDDISPEQNKKYVLELATMLVELGEDTRAFRQCLKDLRTAVAFMVASE